MKPVKYFDLAGKKKSKRNQHQSLSWADLAWKILNEWQMLSRSLLIILIFLWICRVTGFNPFGILPPGFFMINNPYTDVSGDWDHVTISDRDGKKVGGPVSIRISRESRDVKVYFKGKGNWEMVPDTSKLYYEKVLERPHGWSMEGASFKDKTTIVYYNSFISDGATEFLQLDIHFDKDGEPNRMSGRLHYIKGKEIRSATIEFIKIRSNRLSQ